MPNCISRAGSALKIRPKFAVPKVRLGVSKLARLNRLKTSQRSWSRSPREWVIAYVPRAHRAKANETVAGVSQAVFAYLSSDARDALTPSRALCCDRRVL